MSTSLFFRRGATSAAFPGPWRPGRVKLGDREKHLPDPVWNRRIAKLGGLNPFGQPLFKVVWGWSETRVGTVPRFVQGLNKWLLLRWFPPETWGNAVLWYAPRFDDGTWAPSYAEEFNEDFPERGQYDVDYAFDEGAPFSLAFAEHRIRLFQRREKLKSVRARMREDRQSLDAEKAEEWQEDYERFVEASRPFGDAPMVGYGAKSGAPGPKPTMSDTAYQKLRQVHSGRMARLERLARQSSA